MIGQPYLTMRDLSCTNSWNFLSSDPGIFEYARETELSNVLIRESSIVFFSREINAALSRS